METKHKTIKMKVVVIGTVFILFINACSGQSKQSAQSKQQDTENIKYTNAQLDSLYEIERKIVDSVGKTDIKINGLYDLTEDDKILKNIENMYGKPDYYTKWGPYPDENMDETRYAYSYGCFDSKSCRDAFRNLSKNNYENKDLYYSELSFLGYPPNPKKYFAGFTFILKEFKGKEFFITVKGQKISPGDSISVLKKLFPKSYKYYKLLRIENNYAIGFSVYAGEDRLIELYFIFDKTKTIIKEISLDYLVG